MARIFPARASFTARNNMVAFLTVLFCLFVLYWIFQVLFHIFDKKDVLIVTGVMLFCATARLLLL